MPTYLLPSVNQWLLPYFLFSRDTFLNKHDLYNQIILANFGVDYPIFNALFL